MEACQEAAKKTVAQAIRAAARRKPKPSAVFSCFKTDVFPSDGPPIRGRWRHNLTTDTASGYTNRRDWQSKAMGMGPSFAFATVASWAAAGVTISATTLTNSGAAFPTGGQGLQGCLVVTFGLTSQTIRYGVIVANTATALTVDQWYDATSTSGASGATPTTSGGNATAGIGYIVLPGQNPAAWLAVTQNATAPAASDTTLTAELTTSDWARSVGTYSHTAASTTYALVHLFTSTTTVTINKESVFGAANPTAGGVMPFESAEPNPPTLVSGDTLTQTVTITIN